MARKKDELNSTSVDHVLASLGFIFPRTESELDSFDKLYSCYNYELGDYRIVPDNIINAKSSQVFKYDSNKKRSYFERAVLAAEIATQLYIEPTFGHVKLQKLMFLCENIEGMDISYQYSKKAAGPYDNKFMHTIDYEMKKQKWFEVKKEKCGLIWKYTFRPLEKFGCHRTYYKNYFNRHDEKIQWFIETFRKTKTNRVELIATLYACWMELIQKNMEVNNDTLSTLFYNWSQQKLKFSRYEVKDAIEWMNVNDVRPKSISSVS